MESDSRRGPVHPRWIRVNTLKSTVPDQLETTFAGYEPVPVIQPILDGAKKTLCIDPHVPNLLAVSPDTDFTKTEAYKAGAIILQDKASCFPAYLLNPSPEDGDLIDACAAPGNKTTHLGDIMMSRSSGSQSVFAFEKDKNRAKTLERMVKIAGADSFTRVHQGQDFMKVDPNAEQYAKVGALLLDPSCSGSGIVGRDDMPDLHLAEVPSKSEGKQQDKNHRKKRKREDASDGRPSTVMVDDDGETTVLSSEKDLKNRIEALASFQLSLLLHAFRFPAAKKVSYSTCSVYAGENEHVVLKALDSDIARKRGWRILTRENQPRGMREWPVRGAPEACDGNEDIADACIRTYQTDGHGIMGFFVAGFVRDGENADDDDGPYVRDKNGIIIRDENGIPTLKATGKKAVEPHEMYGDDEDQELMQFSIGAEDDDEDGPFVRGPDGQIIRGPDGMPMLKPGAQATVVRSGVDDEDNADSDGEWAGFED
jgi:putative methyltransferase